MIRKFDTLLNETASVGWITGLTLSIILNT